MNLQLKAKIINVTSVKRDTLKDKTTKCNFKNLSR
jgi:hypothetical protein